MLLLSRSSSCVAPGLCCVNVEREGETKMMGTAVLDRRLEASRPQEMESEEEEGGVVGNEG